GGGRREFGRAEARLVLSTAAPPVLPGPRRLSLPLIGPPIAPERLAERARRIDRQFLDALRRQVLGRGHDGRGGLAALHRLPAPVPFLGNSPCIGPIDPAGD